MGNGKRGIAPCGHPGEAVIGQYYKCLSGCDSGNFEEPTVDILQCRWCGSLRVDTDFEVDPMFYLFNPGIPPINARCIDCGKCWSR
jgi:hypothetical protein